MTNGKPRSLGDSIHQVLKVGEDMGIGLVTVFGHDIAVDNYIKLSVGAWG